MHVPSLKLITQVSLISVSLLIAGSAFAKKPEAAPAKRAINPSDVAVMESVRQTAISPDGKTIAFVRSVPRTPLDDKDGGAWSELGVIRADGSTRTYVGGKGSVSSIGFTPDGKAISFLTKRGEDKKTALYTIPIDGGEAMKVAAHKEGIRGYSFHPNGQKVALLATPPGKKEVGDMKKKGFDANIYEESSVATQLWISDVAPRDTETKDPEKIEVKGSVSGIHWSPDGNYIVAAVAPSSLVDDHYMFRQIQLIDVNKKRVAVKIKNVGKLGNVSWSPDGTKLGIIGAVDIHDPDGRRLQYVSATGGTPKDAVPSLTDGSVQDFAWLNNNEMIAILNKGVETGVSRVNVETGATTELIPMGKAIFFSMDLSLTGEMAFTAQTPTHPTEAYGWTAETGLARKTFHNPWMADIAFGKQSAVTYKARDGLEVEGILIEPINRPRGKKVPLILTVHGGPESHYRNGWLTYYSVPGQMAAARGFAVFYPNYRGSTGRGVEYSKLSQGDPAGREFDDVVDAIDHLAKTGLINKNKVGITGGSYGGYASAWGATYYSNRFAASVMFVGVTDLVSKIGTTDIPLEMYNVHYLYWPWEKWDEILRRSPIYYAHQSRTPTLILHGDSDPRVDPGQSKELYRHLKLRGKAPTRLVLYPGEGHGNRRAASRLDYNLRMLRWFEHYLQGRGGAMPDYELDYKKAMNKN